MANKELIINNEELSTEIKSVALLLCISQEIYSKINNALYPLGTSFLQVNILHTLSEAPEGKLTVSQLKELLIDESSNVSRALNKLMANEYIVKERSLDDQRVVNVVVTKKGEELHEKADELLLSIMKLDLPEKQLNALYGVLKQL